MCKLGRCIYNKVDCDICGFSDAAAPVRIDDVEQLIKAIGEPAAPGCSDEEFQELISLFDEDDVIE